MSKAYSAEEVALIKDNYPRIGLQGVQRLLPHRTPAGIQSKAKELGCLKYGRHSWSPDEDAVILAHYKRGGYTACQPLLPGRSKASICNRAWNLRQVFDGVVKDKPAKKKFLAIAQPKVKRTDPVEFSEQIRRRWLPAGAWCMDHQPACRSVFELGVV